VGGVVWVRRGGVGGAGRVGGVMGKAWVVLGVSKDTHDRLFPLKALLAIPEIDIDPMGL
jgi:hypothetical protein